MIKNEVFTVAEVALFLKTSKQQVRKMIQSGEIVAVKVGREYRVTLESLAEFIGDV